MDFVRNIIKILICLKGDEFKHVNNSRLFKIWKIMGWINLRADQRDINLKKTFQSTVRSEVYALK